MTGNTNPASARPGLSHVLRLDYTNKSAQIITPTGDCAAIYSGVHGRADAERRVATDGWRLTPGGAWTYTSPPDGRQHPIQHSKDQFAMSPDSSQPGPGQGPRRRPARPAPNCVARGTIPDHQRGSGNRHGAMRGRGWTWLGFGVGAVVLVLIVAGLSVVVTSLLVSAGACGSPRQACAQIRTVTLLPVGAAMSSVLIGIVAGLWADRAGRPGPKIAANAAGLAFLALGLISCGVQGDLMDDGVPPPRSFLASTPATSEAR